MATDCHCRSKAPPSRVLATFGVDGTPRSLPGGEGRSWLVDAVVLKPVSNRQEAAWVADTLRRIDGVGFRVPEPVRATTGEWVVDGWAAWTRVDGEHDEEGRWGDVLSVSDAFHAALVGVPRPEFLVSRRTPWDVADRVAWDEEVYDVPEPVATLVEELREVIQPVSTPSQVIHGDLTRNVLFAEGQPPAVIDFVPYFRPTSYAKAIVLVDALAWYEASVDVLELAADTPDLQQMLARAALYRMVTTCVAWGHPDRLAHEVEVNRPVVDVIVGRSG